MTAFPATALVAPFQLIDFADPSPALLDAMGAALLDYEEDRNETWIASLPPAERAALQDDLAKLGRMAWADIRDTDSGECFRARARYACRAIVALQKGGAA